MTDNKTDTTRAYWYWLNNIPGIGNAKIRTLLAELDNPYNIFKTDTGSLSGLKILNKKDIENIISESVRNDIFKKYQRELDRGTQFVFPYEEKYPLRLKELYDKPYILYYKGKLPDNNKKNVAIVGSRNCSEYGRHVARELGRVLAAAGCNIISGLANGIDSEAHKGAVYIGGYTCGVLAGGVEHCYPPNNYNLYMDIINSGGVISEFPGDSVTRPGMFPLRNRIISGMTDAVIVVEAGKKSGSLITASTALSQNRDVYAVPGRLGDPTGIGCNELIAAGAMVITDYDSILEDLGIHNYDCKVNCDTEIGSEGNFERNFKINNIALAKEEKILYSLLLDFNPRSLETLICESSLSSEQVLTNLIGLEIKGIICEISKNFYVRVK